MVRNTCTARSTFAARPVTTGRSSTAAAARRAEVVVPQDHLHRQPHDEEEWAPLRRAEGFVRDLDTVAARGGHATVPRRACGRRSSPCCNRIRAPGIYAIGGAKKTAQLPKWNESAVPGSNRLPPACQGAARRPRVRGVARVLRPVADLRHASWIPDRR